MVTQTGFFPTGLSKKQSQVLERLVIGIQSDNPQNYLVSVQEHLVLAKSRAKESIEINIGLAEAIVKVFERVVSTWNQIPDIAKPWLCGSMRYFASFEDEIHDFDSILGFEDDVEVLNACLRLAQLESLLIKPEEFDHG